MRRKWKAAFALFFNSYSSFLPLLSSVLFQWGNPSSKQFRPASMEDGLLEVCILKGSTQMAACKTLQMHPTRLCQARSIKITIKGKRGVPVQVDGEAWMQQPSVITITHKGRVQMLSRDK